MQRLTTWEALQAAVTRIPRRSGAFSTNLYAGREEVERWLSAAPLRSIAADGAVLLLRPDRDFHRVYHVAASASALSAALSVLPPGTYVSDLVGKDGPLDGDRAAYAQAGFAQHEFLRRMTSQRQPGTLPAGGGRAATRAGRADVPEVAAMLERLLDPLVEQLPSIAELEAAVDAARLLIVREEGLLAGMLMYASKGQSAHLQYWHVDQHARGSGIGRRLMADFLADCAQARRALLWVIGTNERSIAIYRHYGFAEDGLLDRIMLLQKE